MNHRANPFQKLRLYVSQVGFAGKYTARYASDHCMWFERMTHILKPYVPDYTGIRALDVGCGLLQWQTILLHNSGAKVTGVDMEYVRADRRPDKYYHLWRTNGLERAVKTAFWDYTYANGYLQALQACFGRPLTRDGMDLRQHTAERLPFGDAEFDLVVSHEVFEHIADVGAAAEEIRRVLKPGGYAYLNIHLFPSISGGHNMAWKYPDDAPSTTVPAWDHLREKKFPEHPSWINEKRERDYRPIFERMFEIVVWEASAIEGKAQLTPQIRAELADYPEEELLKKGIIVLLRKTT
jgi:SAM-dependent methyltransferase